jgi:hypothetical protein
MCRRGLIAAPRRPEAPNRLHELLADVLDRSDAAEERHREDHDRVRRERMAAEARLRRLLDLVAMPPRPSMCFIVTEFGNKFREWCDEAGLPHCTAHGLGKATMRDMAELDMRNQTMKAMSGHSKDDEVARHTREANQKRMADSAVGNGGSEAGKTRRQRLTHCARLDIIPNC